MGYGLVRKRNHPCKINFLRYIVTIIFISMLILGGDSFAGQKSGKATVRKSKNNLHFQVPEDWPIEKRGGIVAPIPSEEYLAIKFQNLELRIRTIEQSLSGIDLRLRVLEEKLKEKKKELRSVEQHAP